MNVSEFLFELYQQGITVQIDHANLKVSSAKGELSPYIQEQLRENKAEIITYLLDQQSANHTSLPLRRTDRSQPIPVSSSQRGLWFQYQLEGMSNTYNVPCLYSLKGNLDVPALEKSLQYLIARHESLRMSLKAVDGEPHPIIAEKVEWELDVHQLNEKNLQQELLEVAARPFSLELAPLFRAHLWTDSGENHTLLLNFHHIILDEWSAGIFENELAIVYGSYATGKAAELPALELDFADYAAWQDNWLKSTEFERGGNYWTEALHGAPELLELPIDHPRPAVQTYRGASVKMDLGPGLADQLQSLVRRESVTLFMTLYSAFTILLGYYSRQEDVVVGAPMANRQDKETEKMLGFFVNTMPLRMDLSGNPTLSELLQRTRKIALEAFAHQDVPFDKLVDTLHLQRNTQYSPVFQTLFVLKKAASQTSFLGEIRLKASSVDIGSAKFDLTLFALPQPEGLQLELNYNADLFDPGTAERMLIHYRRILEWMTSNQAGRLDSLDLLSASEKQQILVDWNSADIDLSEGICAHQLFEEQAELNPQSTAIVFGHQEITYQELDRRANQLAHYLRTAHGVGPNLLVAILMERTPDLIVALLGVLKAGGAYVPLDHNLPQERLRLMCSVARPELILSQRSMCDRLPNMEDVPVVFFDTDWDEWISPYPITKPENLSALYHLAYVLFTSGTTGLPKGVALPHSSTRALVGWVGSNFSLQELSGMLAAASIGFDMSVTEILGTLAWGGYVVLVENVLQVMYYTGKYPIRLIHTVPSAMAELLHAEGIPPTVNTIMLSGEALPAQLVDELYKVPGIRRLYDSYGPTETSNCTLVLRQPNSHATIGKPLPGWKMYILDTHLRPVPIGIPGELFIGGVGLAQGYYGRTDLTEERFPANPYEKNGERFYRTGDVARWLPDGSIEYLGRIDNQVKIRGFRVELTEVENALLKHPHVHQVIVMMRQDRQGDKRLVAYIVPASNVKVDLDALRGFLREMLPSYMLPSAFVVMEAFPLNINGKTDRKALPIPEMEVTDKYLAPRNEEETQLQTIWEKVLAISPIGVDDDFFDIGGNSLLGVRLCMEIEKKHNVHLPIIELFRSPTISQLAQKLHAIPKNEIRAPLQRVERSQAIPVSFVQHGIWLQHEMEGVGNLYNLNSVYRLEGQLDISILEKSLHHLIARHDAFRTCFKVIDGEPYQVIAENVEWKLDVHESDSETAEQELPALAGKPFSLEQAPLMRAHLWKHPEDKYTLLISIHHIVFDGWSQEVFERELAQVYGQFVDCLEPDLQPLELDYADYAVWQRRWLQGEETQKQLAYWRENLKEAPELLELPTDHPRPPIQTFRGNNIKLELEPDLANQLRNLARDKNVTLFMLLNTAYAILLGRYSGQEDVVIGFPAANRQRKELEGILGFFVNMLPLRVDLSGNPGLSEIIQRVQQVSLDAFSRQSLPFEKLVAELVPHHDPQFNPIFQAASVLENASPNLHLGRCAGIRDYVATGKSKYDVLLFAREQENGLHLELEYNADIFEPATIERMLAHYRLILEWMVSNPKDGVRDFSLLTQAERHQILVDWNNTNTDYPREKCIHQLFEEYAKNTPDATAIVFGGREMSYRHLSNRANQMAHSLCELGIGLETPVGLYVERSFEMIIALLAVLKAGGVYVPLDPAYPPERLALILHDTNSPALLTLRKHLPDLPPFEGRIICIDDEVLFTGKSEDNLIQPVKPENLAYIMYTSGSTGLPKGTCIPHRAVVRLVKNTNYANLSTDEVFLQFAPLAFDASTFEIWGSLLNGAKLVIFPPDLASLDELSHFVETNGVTTLWLTAGLFHQAMESTPGIVNRLHQLLSGGDVLSPAHVRKALQQNPNCRLINGYGPTENTTFTCCYTIKELQAEQSVPIGRPTSNTSVYVLDTYGKPVPIGVRGELTIGGDGLARAYINQPELTEQKFIPNPFSSQNDARLYRTGDFVRWLPNGIIEFLGRMDHQVKIRGYRIELAEIEAAIRQYPGIQEVVVLVREDLPGEKRLVAYIVPTRSSADIPSSDKPLDVDNLRSYLKKKLPNYMLPAVFVKMDGLPLSANGKIDRKALPAPEVTESHKYLPAQNEYQEQLVKTWEDLLHVSPIGLDDDFFDMGGNSLLAIQLVNAIKRELNLHLPVIEVFRSSTVRRLAQFIQQPQKQSLSWTPLVEVQPEGQGRPLFFFYSLSVCKNLASALGPDWPIYELEAPSLEAGLNSDMTVEQMATRYLKVIRTVQPSGPYRLLGYCFGGLLAYELACQLEAQGQHTSLLVEIDGIAPYNEEHSWAYWLWNLIENIPYLFRKPNTVGWFLYMVEHSIALGIGNLQKKSPDFVNRLKRLFANRRFLQKSMQKMSVAFDANWQARPDESAEATRPDTETTSVEQQQLSIIRQIQSNYHPQPYAGSVTVFSAKWKESPHLFFRPADPALGWGKLAQNGVDVHSFKGDHHSLYEPPLVNAVAASLKKILQKLDPEDRMEDGL